MNLLLRYSRKKGQKPFFAKLGRGPCVKPRIEDEGVKGGQSVAVAVARGAPREACFTGSPAK